MFPEKEIVTIWLNQQGYLVVRDINAGKNKVVDCLAFKLEKGQLKKAIHVEVSVSVAGEHVAEVQKKFSDALVQKAIRQYLAKYSQTKDYSKLLVMNSPSLEKIGDIEVKPFEAVFIEVLAKLDRKDYSNPTVRTLQLLKHTILTEPEQLRALMEGFKQNGAISNQTLEAMLEQLSHLPEMMRVLAKSRNKRVLEESFKGSPLAKPEALAKLVISSLTTRSFNQFLKELFQHEKAKRFTKKKSPKQKTLQVFLD
ncbi:hypothetical protein DRJ48_04145 [Candidatus Woesearchaeota archaeon]|nr:MAG: hypothetical protein DRJ48_04145 [Candidatus Woesearchaeota archaeon]